MSDTYSYKGAQDVGTTANEYNTRDFQIQQSLAMVRTTQVVQVINPPYDAHGNTIAPGVAGAIGYVDVQVLVNQQDGDGVAYPHGTVYRLPYLRYQGGYGAFISDPKKGDIGKVSVCDRDISVVKSTGKQGNPGSRRKFDLADGIYEGAIVAGAPSQYFSWLEQGFHLQDSYGNTIVGTADGVLINGALVKPNGDVVSNPNKISLDQHIHDGVMTGGGDTTAPVPNT